MVLLRKKGLPRPSGVLNITFSFRSSKGNINSRLKRGGQGVRRGGWRRERREVGEERAGGGSANKAVS